MAYGLGARTPAVISVAEGPRAEGPEGARVLGLTVFGDPFGRRSWSGSNWGLFSTLQRRAVLQSAHSVDLSLPQKLLCAALNFSVDKRQIYLDLMKSRHSFYWRSRNANAVLSREAGNYDCLLQVSALFLPKIPPHVLHCSYHDGNTAVSRRPEFSFMSAASKRVMQESWKYETEFYSKVDLVFTMSEWLRQSMIMDFGVAEERVVTVGAGINFGVTPPEDWAPPRDSRTKSALFVATNFEFKGGPTLVEAFRRVRKEVSNAELVIVGCRPALNGTGIRVIGRLDKTDPAQERLLRQLYNEASLFVLPTLYDAFGIAFIEAMHHRLPCIGSKRCAVPEIIADGQTGFLVDPTNVDELTEKMLLLFQDETLAKTMGEQGYQRARSNYTWERVVDRMQENIGTKLGRCRSESRR